MALRDELSMTSDRRSCARESATHASLTASSLRQVRTRLTSARTWIESCLDRDPGFGIGSGSGPAGAGTRLMSFSTREQLASRCSSVTPRSLKRATA